MRLHPQKFTPFSGTARPDAATHLLAQAYRSDGVPANEDAVGRLQAVLGALPRTWEGDAASQAALVDAATSWADSAIAWAGRWVGFWVLAFST